MTYYEAKKKSQYGGYLHIAWKQHGIWVAERLNANSLKRAMLDSGTQDKFICFDRGQSSYVWWSLAAMWLRQMKRGMFTYQR